MRLPVARRRRPRARRFPLVAALTLASCSAGASAVDPLPPPPSTEPRPSTTAPPDYSGVVLPPVRGRTTTSAVVLGPGVATIKGTAVAPDGTPAVGATVRVQRLVGAGTATIDVAVAADGTWSAQNILGGSYRVRAWRSPDIALGNLAFFFVGATETVPVELKLERNFGTTPQPAVAPNPPVVGQTTNLVLQLSSRSVDPEGVVQGVPMAAATVELAGGPGWAVRLPNPAVTDASGRARWELVCNSTGVQSIRLVVNGTEPFQLALPACAPPPVPVTTATTVAGVTTTRPATTTTRPAIPSTTTTTTRPRRP